MFDRILRIGDFANIPITLLAYLGGVAWLWNWLGSQHVAMNSQVFLVVVVVIIGVGTLTLQLIDRFRPGLVRAKTPRADSMPLPLVGTRQEWTDFKLEIVPNRRFTHEPVDLDGKHFMNCTFMHVNLSYDGIAPMAFSGCEFDADTVTHIHSRNPAMAQWMECLRGLGLLKPEAQFAFTPLS